MKDNRWAARLAIATLIAGALVPLTGGSAGATPGCIDETRPTIEIIPGIPIPNGDGCDDDTPPETFVAAATTPNAAGYVATATMTFTITSQVSDGDAGPFGLECKLSVKEGGPAQTHAHDWRTCTSPVTYAALPDAAAGAYTFEARTVDLGDAGRNPDDGFPPTITDTPDLDPTPAKVVWGQDTKAPFIFVTPEAYDEETPSQPVVTTEAVTIRLNSSERDGASFECTDNGAPVACSAGKWALTGAAAGRHVFTARTVDQAGNASAWAEPIEFFVPLNLKRSMGPKSSKGKKGWKKVHNKQYFGGDALLAKKRGVRLVLPRTKVGELRLLAATDPSYGKVRIRVGKKAWHVVNLAGKASMLKQFIVIDRFSGMRRGKITIETLSNKPVVIDAVVARPNTFPTAT